MTNLLFSVADFSKNLVEILSNTLGIWYLIILNAFGVIAIGCKICEYQAKSRTKILTFATIASICWVLYFAFYGSFASTLTCFLSVIRMFIFMQRGKHAWADSIIWLIVFLVLQIVVAVFTVSSILDVFSVVAGIFGVLAYFVINPTMFRALSFIHMTLWVVNSIINFFPIALISNSASTVSCAVAIYRYDLSKKARSLKRLSYKEKATDQVQDSDK